jgi:hypothetical protein
MSIWAMGFSSLELSIARTLARASGTPLRYFGGFLVAVLRKS